MGFPTNTPDQIFQRMRDRMSADGRFTALSSTSTTRMLMELFAGEIGIAHSRMLDAFQQTQLSYATGDNLESIGDIVGITRRTATRATDNTTANVKFFVDPALGLTIEGLIQKRMTGVEIEAAGDTITPRTIVIREGMVIQDSTLNKRYITTTDVELSGEEVYVPVIAEGIGSLYNVGIGELSRWDWESQPEFQPLKDFVLVTNTASITSGSTVESDDSLRIRIFNSVIENAKANGLSIQQAALSVPGVRTATVIGGYKGPGTYKINITGTSPIVSEGLINNVRQVVESVSAVGAKAFVDRPTYSGVDMKIILLLSDTNQNHDEIMREVRSNIVSYINNIEIGGTLIINEIRERIQSTSEGILDHIIATLSLGEFNPQTAINENLRSVSIVNQKSDLDQKFYTNISYIKVCE